MQYQVTLICASNKYKPVSALINREGEGNSTDLTKIQSERKKIISEGIEKICHQRYWSSADLKRFSYTKVKVRLYDKKKIEEESAKRYEAIKEAKYANGEWKRPKSKTS